MKIQKMPEDIVPLLNQLITKITALETRPLGTVYVSEKIVVQDPITGVETIIGDLTEYGEDRNGIKQWVNDTEPPAVPVVPIVTTNLGVFSVVWSGFFKDDAPMAPDFSHLNVYGNNGTSTKLVGVIKTQDEVAIVTSDSENMYDEVWSFWFTSVDQVGNESSAGEISPNNKLTPLVESPDIQGAIDDVYNKIQEDFEKSMTAANGKNRIWHTPEPPVADPEFPFIDGDTWFDTNDGNKIYIWKSLPAPAHWEAAVLDSSALDDKVTDLIQQAKDQSDTAIETANGKNKAWHSPTAPTGTNHNVGDIWFDTDDENKIYVWDGTKWDLSSADYEIPQSVLDDIAYAKGRSDSAYTLANGKNKRVDSINNPPTNTTGYIAGDHWLKWSNLGTTGVLLQSWTVKGSSWILDSMDPTYLPKVDIGQGTFGSLNGDRLTANTVTAEKILVSATDNLIRDPNFNFPDTMWVNQTDDMGSGPEKWSTSITYAGGARSMVLTQKPLGSNQASYAATPSDYFEVVPGDSYAAFSMVYSDNGTDPSATRVQQRVYFYDKNKNILSGSTGNQLAGGIEAGDWTTLQWNKVGGVSTVTVPAGAAYMKPRLTVYRTANTTPGNRKYYVGSISVMRAMDSTLITPESIQTPHIKAGAITAESGIIASLDAGKITTGQMHGKYIEAGTLLASKLAVRNNDNLVPNLTYEASDWTLSGGTTIIDTALSSEGKRFDFPATAGAQAIAYDVQVIPGEKIKVECTTYGTNSSQNIELCWFGKDGKGISAGSGVLIRSTTSNQKLSYVWTVPSTVFSVRFCVRVPYTAPVNTAVTGAYDFIVRKMTGTVLIEDGAVTADQIKTGTITAESGIIGSIDASKIVVGELNGKLIKSGTVMTESLVVADPNNYATIDPQRNIDVTFPTEWSTENDGTWAKTKASSQSYLFFRDRLGPIPFKTGEKFLVQFTAKATSAVTGTMRAYFYPDKGSTSGVISVSITDVSLTTAESYTSVEVTVPNITSIVGSGAWTLGFAGTSAKEISVKDVRILRMVDATVITNGAITTNKIDASAVTTEKLMTNAVTADKILAGAITASKLDVNSVDAKNIISNSITVDKLNITDFATLAPLLSEASAWDLQNNATISPSGLSVTGKRLKFLNTVGSSFAYGPYTACKEGDEFFLSTKIYRDTGVSGGMYLRCYWYKADKTASATPFTQVSGGTETNFPSASLLSGSAKAPADAVYARFCVAVVSHTGDMGAYDMSGRRKNGGELIVDGAIDGKTITGALIQTDRAVNVGVKLSNAGIEAYSPQGEKTFSITAGQGVDYIGVWGNDLATIDEAGNIIYPSGAEPEQMVSLDYLGGISGSELSISDYARFDGNVVINGDPLQDSHLGSEAPGEWGPVINGRSLLGTTFTNFVDQHPQVNNGHSWLTPLAHGFKANAYTNTGVSGTLSADGRWKWSGGSGGLVERMMIQQQVDIVDNRGYLLTYSVPAVRSTDGSGGTVGASVVRYTSSSSLNVNTGGTLDDTRIYIPGNGVYFNPTKTVYFVGGQDVPAGTITFGIQVYVYDNRTMETTDTADARYWNISIVDLGLATKGGTGKSVNLYRKLPVSTTPEETSPPPPPPVPEPKQYTKTWNASWWGTYDSSGVNTYYDSRGRVAQGRPPGAGIQRGLVGFPSVTGTLSGATMKKVEIYVYAAHWYYSSGGTLVLGTHGLTSKPGSYASGDIDVKRQKLGKPEGRWITLPSSVHAGFKSGSLRGIQAYINTTSLSYYGYLTGSKTKLRITYVK